MPGSHDAAKLGKSASWKVIVPEAMALPESSVIVAVMCVIDRRGASRLGCLVASRYRRCPAELGNSR
jgi:hypothetical protein